MGIGNSMESTVLQNVGTGCDQNVFVVEELPDPMVAVSTQEPAHFLSSMVVVNTENLAFVIARRQRWALADSTLPTLFSEHTVVACKSDAVVVPELAGAKLKFPVFNKLSVKNFLHVWFKRTFGAARLIWSAVANSNVGVHSAEVVLSSADGAGSLIPDTAGFPIGAHFDAIDYNGRFVFLKPTPVIVSERGAFFALVALAAGITDRHRKIALEILYCLAKRANVLFFFQGRSLVASQEMFLQEALVNHRFAKGAKNLFWKFHLSSVYQKVTSLSREFGDFTGLFLTPVSIGKISVSIG